jgi:hypothetical protein
MPLWCVLFPGTSHLEPYKPVAQYALNPIMVRTVSWYLSSGTLQAYGTVCTESHYGAYCFLVPLIWNPTSLWHSMY